MFFSLKAAVARPRGIFGDVGLVKFNFLGKFNRILELFFCFTREADNNIGGNFSVWNVFTDFFDKIFIVSDGIFAVHLF